MQGASLLTATKKTSALAPGQKKLANPKKVHETFGSPKRLMDKKQGLP
jgi:hypothetical protein